MNLQAFKSSVTLMERCAILSALRRSLSYLHHFYLSCEGDKFNQRYWLAEIREAYGLYRQIDFNPSVVRPEDRYFQIVRWTTKESA